MSVLVLTRRVFHPTLPCFCDTSLVSTRYYFRVWKRLATVSFLGPFSPPIVPFCPSFVCFESSDIHGAGSSASPHHCISLVIVCGSSFASNLCIFSISRPLFLYNNRNNEWATQKGINIFESRNAIVCYPSRMSAILVTWGTLAPVE
jgi:hypothetical protein